MNVTKAKQKALAYLGETGAYWTDPEIISFADDVNQLVHAAILSIDTAPFAKTDNVVYPANSEFIDLSDGAYLKDTPKHVVGIQVTQLAGNPTPTNMPTPLELIGMTDLLSRYSALQRSGQVVISGGTVTQQPAGYFCAVSREIYLYVAPMPTIALNLRVRWVPYLPEITALGDLFLGGAAPRWQGVIPPILAKFLTTKEKRQTPSLDEVVRMLRDTTTAAESFTTPNHTMRYEDPYG